MAELGTACCSWHAKITPTRRRCQVAAWSKRRWKNNTTCWAANRLPWTCKPTRPRRRRRLRAVDILVSNLVRNAFSTRRRQRHHPPDSRSLVISDTAAASRRRHRPGLPAPLSRHQQQRRRHRLSLVKRICDRYGWQVRLRAGAAGHDCDGGVRAIGSRQISANWAASVVVRRLLLGLTGHWSSEHNGRNESVNGRSPKSWSSGRLSLQATAGSDQAV